MEYFDNSINFLKQLSEADEARSKNEGFLCSFCATVFSTRNALIRHEKMEHMDEGNLKFPCQSCSRKFGSHSALMRHKKGMHPDPSDFLKYSCSSCELKFINSKALYHHKATVHSLNDKPNIRCLECGMTFQSLKVLRSHLTAHGLSMDCHQISFGSMSEFNEWKADMEQGTSTFYVNRYGERSGRLLLYCSRTGFYEQTAPRKRKLKSQGSSKLNMFCTSAIEVSKKDDGSIDARYWPNHYGHDVDMHHLGHLHLHKKDVMVIQQKLLAGTPFNHIISDVQSDFSPSVKRIHALTKKDLHNISRSLGISNKGLLGSCEADSLEMFVEKCRESKDVIILYHKKNGESHDVYSNEDIILSFQTYYQQRRLVDLGCHVICVDLTHSSSTFDYDLITMSVMSEEGSSLPVAWLITSVLSDKVIECFYEAVINSVVDNGEKFPLPTFFLTDKSVDLYGAWSRVTGSKPIQLLCSWHCQREWKSKLASIEDSEVQDEIYGQLCALQLEIDEETAKMCASNLASRLTSYEPTQEFGLYFLQNWLPILGQWCSFTHLGSCLNTRLFLDSFHKMMKHETLGGKQRKCLNKSVHRLLDYSRKFMFEWLKKEMKEDKSEQQLEIEKVHDEAVAEFFPQMIRKDHNKWLICHQASAQSFCVFPTSLNCPLGTACRLKCDKCDMCGHEYVCDCPEGRGVFLCKHVHMVKIASIDDIKEIHVIEEVVPSVAAYSEVVMETLEAPKPNPIMAKLEKKLRCIANLFTDLDTTDRQIVEVVDNIMQSLSSIENECRTSLKKVGIEL